MKRKDVTPEILHELLTLNRDGTLTWRKRGDRSWDARWAGTPALATIDRGHGYRYGGIYRHKFYAHRVVFIMAYGYRPDFVDHIDHNRSNNHLDNLRNVTHKQNNQNTTMQRNNTSGVTGLTWCGRDRRWVVQVGNASGGSPCFGRALHKLQHLREKQGVHPNHGRSA